MLGQDKLGRDILTGKKSLEELASYEHQQRNETQEIFIPVADRLGVPYDHVTVFEDDSAKAKELEIKPGVFVEVKRMAPEQEPDDLRAAGEGDAFSVQPHLDAVAREGVGKQLRGVALAFQIGGIGRIEGPIIGAVVYYLLRDFVNNHNWLSDPAFQKYKDASLETRKKVVAAIRATARQRLPIGVPETRVDDDRSKPCGGERLLDAERLRRVGQMDTVGPGQVPTQCTSGAR